MTLERWLRKTGMTQMEASRLLGMPQSSINRITRESLPPTLRNAAKIVRATGGEVGYEDLLGPTVTRTLWRFNGRLVPEGVPAG